MNFIQPFKIDLDYRKKETTESQINVFLKVMMSQSVINQGSYLPSIEDLAKFNHIDPKTLELVYLKLAEEGYLTHDTHGFLIDKLQLKTNFFDHSLPPLKAIEQSGLHASFDTLKIVKGQSIPNDFALKEESPSSKKFLLIRNLYYANHIPILLMDTYVLESMMDSKTLKKEHMIDMHQLFEENNIITDSIKSIIRVKKAPNDVLEILNAPKESSLIHNDAIHLNKEGELICAEIVHTALNYIFKTTTYF